MKGPDQRQRSTVKDTIGIPAATRRAMAETEAIMNGTSSAKAFHSVKDIMNSLDRGEKTFRV